MPDGLIVDFVSFLATNGNIRSNNTAEVSHYPAETAARLWKPSSSSTPLPIHSVIPAKAGISVYEVGTEIPACAGMTR
jgi:hypothetical protein